MMVSVSVAVGCWAARGRPVGCEQANIDVHMLENAGLRVVSSDISYGIGENRLALQNETGRTIVKLTVLVNYLDSNGKSIYSVPFFGALDESAPPPKALRPYIRTILRKRVAPHETFPLWGTNLQSTRVASARAEVTYVQIEDDQSNGGFTISDPSTEPLLFKSPEWFEMHVGSAKLPDETWVNLSIDERGRVKNVEVEPVPADVGDRVGQIKSQLMLWSFFPATRGFSAVKSQQVLWLRFHDEGFPLPAPICPLALSSEHSQTFVEVDLSRVSEEHWEVRYAGHYARGRFNTIVSTFLSE
jgi:hypothetical protein